MDVELDDSDYYGYTKYDDPRVLGLEKVPLVVQMLLLANVELILASNAKTQLVEEEVAPFAARVLACRNPSNSTLRSLALLIRTRVETFKGKYQQRNVLQMEELSDYFFKLPESDSPASDSDATMACERLALIYGVNSPARWELRKEQAIVNGQNGLVKTAVEIFEELEMWDEVVDCYRVMQDLGPAITLVTKRIEQDGQTPALLTVLADLAGGDEKLYETAWQMSNCSYGKAKRSLAKVQLVKEKYKEAIENFHMALALNPLYPSAWFSVGFAAIQIRDFKTAARAFTRVVQQEPDNGEAWNNLGKSLLESGDKDREALSAFLRSAALNRGSWQTWENCLVVALELHAHKEAIAAMEHLVTIRDAKGVKPNELRKVSYELIKEISDGRRENETEVAFSSRQKNSRSITSLRLIPLISKCSALVSSEPAIWDALAMLHGCIGRPFTELAYRWKQVRAVNGNAKTMKWENDKAAFEVMVDASMSLVRAGEVARKAPSDCEAAYENKQENKEELAIPTLVQHLSSILQRSKETFATEEGYKQLERELDALKLEAK